MKKKPHKPGVNKNFVLKRHLKLEGLRREEGSKVITAIIALVGVDEASISEKNSVLRVAYDGSTRRLEDIEEVLQAHGCFLAHDWWTNLKMSWYHCADENVRANALHVPHCCNKPPR